MRDTVAILVRYNTYANRDMTKVLSGIADPKILTANRGSYFQSIVGILNHILGADFIWFNRLRDSFPSLQSLKSSLIPSDLKSASEIHYSSLSDWESISAEVDEIFSNLAEELDETTLETRFTYTNAKGQTMTARLFDVMLHLLNHQAHHRGQISQILDESGIENDFSSVLKALQ